MSFEVKWLVQGPTAGDWQGRDNRLFSSLLSQGWFHYIWLQNKPPTSRQGNRGAQITKTSLCNDCYQMKLTLHVNVTQEPLQIASHFPPRPNLPFPSLLPHFLLEGLRVSHLHNTWSQATFLMPNEMLPKFPREGIHLWTYYKGFCFQFGISPTRTLKKKIPKWMHLTCHL